MRVARLVALIACLLPVPMVAHATPERMVARDTAPRGAMARIPAGTYRPLYATLAAPRTPVAAFRLDREPVTRGEFLAFLTTHARWRRDMVRRVFADAAYLAEWPGATSAGDADARRRPVTGVSWFAARAYCAASGRRLPTLDEWEYVAAASATRRDASADASARRELLARYTSRVAGRVPAIGGAPNVFGVRDLHGVVWEWTLDFNSVVVGDDSRASGSGQDAREHHLYCASSAIGATDPSDYPAFARFAMRAALTARSTTGGVGFRCAA
jgi:sulfatase modifying factor 1